MASSIYALTTAVGRAGVAITRLSGCDALSIAQKLAGAKPLPSAGRTLRKLYHNAKLIDHALLLTFESHSSFTGEPVVEFHTHGSVAVINALSNALSHYARAAEAGEFTRRALENERLDLAQVEGLSDLIEAETEAQLKQANRAMSGVMAQKLQDWRADLIRAASLIEATIDFADEDIPQDVMPEVQALVEKTIITLEAEIKGSYAAQRIREGFEVAIIGPPNIGKSTLLNALAGRDAAITSDIAGTTRDVIELRMNLQGLPVTFLDTAGIRESTERIENIGINRTKLRAQTADLRVFLTLDGIPELPAQQDDIIAIGKADKTTKQGFAISGITGAGVELLLQKITNILEKRASLAQTASHARHRQAITRALEALRAAQDIGDDLIQAELVAAELRRANHALSTLIGAVGVEDLLDEVFSRFCIGK